MQSDLIKLTESTVGQKERIKSYKQKTANHVTEELSKTDKSLNWLDRKNVFLINSMFVKSLS